MKKILRMLVPVDFTPESQLALDWAQMVARSQIDSTIFLLHALPLADRPQDLGMASIAYQMELIAIQHKMKRLQDRLPPEVITFPLYETGRVAEAIARVCENQNIDLVVMTTRGRRGQEHLLDGSVSEETVRIAPCPVLVLHRNERVENMIS
jgi:nucleotide-binding universal stress UspA family protein